jgi:hypothetical protein
MKKIITSVMLGLVTLSANALGDREQGALIGIAGTLLWQKLDQQNQQNQPPPIIYRNPPYQYPVIIQERIPRIQQCTAWREVLQYDGTLVRERTCYHR